MIFSFIFFTSIVYTIVSAFMRKTFLNSLVFLFFINFGTNLAFASRRTTVCGSGDDKCYELLYKMCLELDSNDQDAIIAATAKWMKNSDAFNDFIINSSVKFYNKINGQHQIDIETFPRNKVKFGCYTAQKTAYYALPYITFAAYCLQLGYLNHRLRLAN